MAKATLAEKLHQRQIHSPNPVLYGILYGVIKILNLKVKPSFTFKARPGEEKGAFLMISNHASRVEYQFVEPACWPRRLNYVVGYNEFFRFPLNVVLNLMQVIPKKNFTPDIYAVKQMLRVRDQGGAICLMPEGMSSITGMAQPVMIGSGKLVKKLGIPVYYTKLSGAYLTYPKHCLDERPGRIEVVVDKMFTPDELKTMSSAEIEERMNCLLAHDDYIWNKQAQVKFKGWGEMAKNLDTLLYLCPKCGAMHQMECSRNVMKCLACGNIVEMDECYNIKAVGDDSVCPELVTDWTLMERRKAAEDVKAPDFSFSEHVKIGKLPDYKLLKHVDTSVICGEGTLTLDHSGLHFAGKKDGADFSFHMASSEVPTFGMCTDITRFYTFVDGEFVEFFPDSGDVLRWDHLTEEMHRFHGGKWQDTEYRHI